MRTIRTCLLLASAILSVALITTSSLASMELLFTVHRLPWAWAAPGPNDFDFDGDGRPEICVGGLNSDTEQFQVYDGNGVRLWSLALPWDELCPECTHVYIVDFAGFADFDPAPGREAAFEWQGDGAGDTIQGVAVFSTQSSQLLFSSRNGPYCRIRECGDFNDNGFTDLLVQVGADPLPVYTFCYGEPNPSAVPVPQIAPVAGAASLACPSSKPGVSLSLEKEGTARIAIYSLDGRLVRTLFDGPLPAGDHRLIWDGKDADGNSAGQGVYFARVITPTRSTFVKMVLA